MVQRSRRPPHRPHVRSEDTSETIQGLRAGLAVYMRRRDDVLRVAYSHNIRSELTDLIRWCTSTGVSCDPMGEGELDRLAGDRHHEGLCVVARPRKWLAASDLAGALTHPSGKRGTAVALDRVRNPYNVGAILRSAAFFGVDAVLLGTPAPHPGLAPAAVRVAEGGAEHLQMARTTDLAETLARLRSRGIRIIGADGESPTNAQGFAFGRPAVLVVGNEREGLGDRIRAQCDAVVAIRGAGSVESLNVAVAAAVLVAEMTRR